jgi:hypothetical protein
MVDEKVVLKDDMQEPTPEASEGIPAPTGFQPLIVDPSRLYPLPQSMWDSHCDHCDKRQSRWMFVPVDMVPIIQTQPGGRVKGHIICSLCWLYESEWGLKRREALDQMIREVELETMAVFAKTEDGRLFDCKDANRILAAIAMTSRIFVQRSRMRSEAAAEDRAMNPALILPGGSDGK